MTILEVKPRLIRFKTRHYSGTRDIYWEARYCKGWDFFMDGEYVKVGRALRQKVFDKAQEWRRSKV